MRLTTSLNHYNKAKSRLTDLLSRAKIYGLAHDDILTEYVEILKSVKYCPSWVQDRLGIVFSERWDAFHRYGVIVWELYLDGAKILDKDVPSGRWAEVKGRYNWKENGNPI